MTDRVCFAYVKKGECRYGQQCRFQHVRTAGKRDRPIPLRCAGCGMFTTERVCGHCRLNEMEAPQPIQADANYTNVPPPPYHPTLCPNPVPRDPNNPLHQIKEPEKRKNDDRHNYTQHTRSHNGPPRPQRYQGQGPQRHDPQRHNGPQGPSYGGLTRDEAVRKAHAGLDAMLDDEYDPDCPGYSSSPKATEDPEQWG